VKSVKGSPILYLVYLYIYIYIYVILGAPGLEKVVKKNGEERVKIGLLLLSFRKGLIFDICSSLSPEGRGAKSCTNKRMCSILEL